MGVLIKDLKNIGDENRIRIPQVDMDRLPVLNLFCKSKLLGMLSQECSLYDFGQSEVYPWLGDFG